MIKKNNPNSKKTVLLKISDIFSIKRFFVFNFKRARGLCKLPNN